MIVKPSILIISWGDSGLNWGSSFFGTACFTAPILCSDGWTGSLLMSRLGTPFGFISLTSFLVRFHLVHLQLFDLLSSFHFLPQPFGFSISLKSKLAILHICLSF